ncbi:MULTISPECIES: BON domain-containing protein [Halomonas]|uniref:BON domain-containing protein n=1 Tax=Halomonas ventosae TaxID=229007 RepID=A0A4R6GNH9_9GAMM|nr:BON domain-containing protein [Halomonas ventosae]TDN95925.1 BON domain-containing protein [Halomonas ventosae]
MRHRHHWLGSLTIPGVVVAGLLVGCADAPVNESARVTQQDSLPAVQIKARLLEAPDLAGSAIDIELQDGRATLSGFVETSEQRRRAEAIAHEHDKVDTIDNQITVK